MRWITSGGDRGGCAVEHDRSALQPDDALAELDRVVDLMQIADDRDVGLLADRA